MILFLGASHPVVTAGGEAELSEVRGALATSVKCSGTDAATVVEPAVRERTGAVAETQQYGRGGQLAARERRRGCSRGEEASQQ